MDEPVTRKQRGRERPERGAARRAIEGRETALASGPPLPRRGRAAEILVGGVWIAMSVAALGYVARYGSVVPFGDDVGLVPQWTGSRPVTWEWLWASYNQHRLPLPRLILVGLLRFSGGDLRAGMFFQVVLLALAALASILAARKIRSRTSALDLVFPLLWLHWGNYENLLMAHQVAIVLPGCLCAIVAARVAASPTIASARSTILVGACVLALPLCGGGGVAQAPALALWLLLSGLAGWRSGGTARRSTAAILLACAALAIAFIVLYVLRFPGTQEFRRSPDLASTLATAARFSALALGAAGETVWPLSLAIVAGAVLPAAVLLASVACARTGERVRAAGLLCCMAAVASIAWSVGWARPEGGERSGFAVRYVTLPAPLLAGSVFAWLALGSPAVARWVQGALLVALAALLPLNTRAGIDFGERRSALAASFLRDVEAGLSSDELSFRHWRTMHPNPRPFAAMLALLREARLGPFRRGSWPAEIDEGRAGPYLMLEAQPLRVFPPALVMPRKAGGRDVLMAPPESELVFEIPPGAHSLRGVFGIAPESYTRARRSTDGVRFVVEMRRQGQAPQELPELLFERLLEPQGRREDRGFQSLCVDLPEGARGTLVLRTLNDPGMDRRGDLAFWTELAFD